MGPGPHRTRSLCNRYPAMCHRSRGHAKQQTPVRMPPLAAVEPAGLRCAPGGTTGSRSAECKRPRVAPIKPAAGAPTACALIMLLLLVLLIAGASATDKHTEAAVVMVRQGDLIGAEAEFEAAVSEVRSAKTITNAGVCKMRLGKHDEAEKHFLDALTMLAEASHDTEKVVAR